MTEGAIHLEENEDGDNSNQPIASNKSNWNPKRNRVTLLDNCIDGLTKSAAELESFPIKPCKDNISRSERKALNQLKLAIFYTQAKAHRQEVLKDLYILDLVTGHLGIGERLQVKRMFT